MVSLVNFGQISDLLRYYSQINTDSHMASKGHQDAVSQGVQSLYVQSEESQSVQQIEEMKPPAETEVIMVNQSD